MRRDEKSSIVLHILAREVGNLPRTQKWLERIAEGLDLSEESIPGQPIVELYGESRVLIEHHHGITQYSDTLISVKVSFGCVQVEGDGLELGNMSRERLIVRGRIRSVRLERR